MEGKDYGKYPDYRNWSDGISKGHD